jgi:hypothetical protein
MKTPLLMFFPSLIVAVCIATPWAKATPVIGVVVATPPPRLTYVAAGYGEIRAGVSFSLAPHLEAYRLNSPVFVELWFRTAKPYSSYFNGRTGLKYAVTDPHGNVLKASEKTDQRSFIFEPHRNVYILNGETTLDDLSTLYSFREPGSYTVAATVTLLNPQGVTLIAPPITIRIQN